MDYADHDLSDPAARRRAIAADMAEQHAKRPVVDPNGRPRPYAEQPATYRSAVTRQAHVAAHGDGERAPSWRDQPAGPAGTIW